MPLAASAFRTLAALLLALTSLLEPNLPCSAAPISLADGYHLPLGETDTDELLALRSPQTDGRPQFTRLFNMETEPVTWGMVLEKWQSVRIDIARDLKTVATCRADGRCPVPAQELLDLSLQGAAQNGLARVGLINRAVNLAIVPVSDDIQWGVPDHWSGPFETLRSHRGDCEDYAIVKYAALLAAGISADDLKIVILRIHFPLEHHVAAAARVDGRWLILDNRTLSLVRDKDLTRAIPEFVLDEGGVSRFIRSSRSIAAR